MKYQVIVYGAVWYETSDELCTHAYAHHTKATGWKNVTIRKVL